MAASRLRPIVVSLPAVVGAPGLVAVASGAGALFGLTPVGPGTCACATKLMSAPSAAMRANPRNPMCVMQGFRPVMRVDSISYAQHRRDHNVQAAAAHGFETGGLGRMLLFRSCLVLQCVASLILAILMLLATVDDLNAWLKAQL